MSTTDQREVTSLPLGRIESRTASEPEAKPLHQMIIVIPSPQDRTNVIQETNLIRSTTNSVLPLV